MIVGGMFVGGYLFVLLVFDVNLICEVLFNVRLIVGFFVFGVLFDLE